jgi:hypothetical protein
MNTTRAAIVIVLLAGLALPALGQDQNQVRYGGYLSFEYIKGQAESDSPRGSLENLLAGFLVAGTVSQKFGFAVEAQARGVSSFDLLQAWAGFLPSKTVTVRVGLFLVPFGTWNRASRPHETILVQTPLNLELLYPPFWRDLGLLVEGQVGVLSYAAYIGNGLAGTDGPGAAQQFSDNNTDKAKGGRIGLGLGQGIQAGVSYYMGKYDEQNLRDLTLEGADLSWVTAQWEVRGEYTKSSVENPQPFERGESEGFYVLASMSFKSLQPFGSFQKNKYVDSYRGVDLNRSRWCAGVRWVLGQTLFLKLEYDWNKEKEAVALKNNQFQAQIGLSF